MHKNHEKARMVLCDLWSPGLRFDAPTRRRQ
jgi:hypothetical protein